MSRHLSVVRAGLVLLSAASVMIGISHSYGTASAQDGTPIPLVVPTLTATTEYVITITPTRTSTAFSSTLRVEARDAGLGANLRKGPGTDTDLAGNIKPGQFFPVVGRYREWLLIQYGGGTAWVYKEVVNLVGGEFDSLPEMDSIPESNVLNDGTVVAQSTATYIARAPGGALTATAAQGSATGVFTLAPDSDSDGAVALADIPQITFTFAPPVIEATLPVRANLTVQGGLPPAVPILGLSVLGFAGLLVGMIRRLFR